MNKNAAIATFIALGIALIAYFLMRFAPTVAPPHRIWVDSLISNVSGGKRSTDTVWKKVPDFKLTNQLGQTVSWKDMKDKIVVADFIFTTCPEICPQMTRNMKMLQDAIKNNNKVGDRHADFVQFISFTVDPERDSVPRLKAFADRFQIDPQNWWLLTGDKKQIYDLAREGMMEGVEQTNVDSAFIHPQRFYLIDKERVVRARKDELGNVHLYYGLDSNDVRTLAEDIVLLSLEKDPHKKSFLAGKLELIAVVFVIAAIGLVAFFTYLKREKKTA